MPGRLIGSQSSASPTLVLQAPEGKAESRFPMLAHQPLNNTIAHRLRVGYIVFTGLVRWGSVGLTDIRAVKNFGGLSACILFLRLLRSIYM